jgi:deazaflavin-dependent oxidoreductase (nitroreductase family)
VDLVQRLNRIMGERMAASGMMAMLEVTGRTSGRRIRTPVGYVLHDDGRVWVGAGRAESHWPRNLIAEPRCRVGIRGSDRAYVAAMLDGEAREAAIAAIRGKYGSRAGRVGTGPVFELRPAADEAAA